MSVVFFNSGSADDLRVILWIRFPFFMGASVSSVSVSFVGRFAASLSVSLVFSVGFCFLLSSRCLRWTFFFGFLVGLVRCAYCGVHLCLTRSPFSCSGLISVFPSGFTLASFCVSLSCWVFCILYGVGNSVSQLREFR